MYLEGKGKLRSSIRAEVDFPGQIAKGARGIKAQRVQEWLEIHGFGLDIDGDYGNITKGRVADFQTKKKLNVSGKVNAKTWAELTSPMRAVLQPLSKGVNSVRAGILDYAKQHLKQRPFEVGGPNGGPWVRMYMDGNEGPDFPWCAGFVSFLMEQAAEHLATSTPIKGSVSCDVLAQRAQSAGIFLSENDATTVNPNPGSLFLVRRVAGDWTHVGVVSSLTDGGFHTIEGNTNQAGSREGIEVRARVRGFSKKDFIQT